MPEFKVEWSFSEVVEADDKESAVALVRERVEDFVAPRKFRVERNIQWNVEAMPAKQDPHRSS